MKKSIVSLGVVFAVLGAVVFAFAVVSLPHTATEEYIVRLDPETTDKSFKVYVYDPRTGSNISKYFTAKVTVYKNDVGVRDITEYYPLLSSGFSYVGLVVLWAGMGIMIIGLRKETTKSQVTTSSSGMSTSMV